MQQTLAMQRTAGLAIRTVGACRQFSPRSHIPLLPNITRSLHLKSQVVRAGFYGAKDDKPPTRPNDGPNWLDQKTSPPAVSDLAAAGESDISTRTAASLRNLSVFSFWTQLSLSVVSGVILFFAIQSGSAPGRAPNVSVYFTLVGVIFSFVSTFLAHGARRRAWAILERGDSVATGKVVSSLLRNITINLWGLGATIIGLQATVGTLVAKTLTTSTSNPYAANPTTVRGAPAALDAFSIQASTNTVLAHFASIVFANWLLRILNRAAAKATA
jgi:hypothetical protein